MTAACGGGTSQAKSWVPAVAWIGGESLVATVAAALGLSATWPALLAYAAGQTIASTNFCGSDPPAMQPLTHDDIIGIITGAGPGAFTGPQKLNNIVLNGIWATFCECVSQATPTLPAAPVYPSDGAVVNPTGLPQQTQLPCYQTTIAPRYQFVNTGCQIIDVTQQLLPAAASSPTSTVATGCPAPHGFVIPIGIHNITFSAKATDGNGVSFAQVGFWDASGTSVGGTNIALPAGGGSGAPFNVPIPANAVGWSAWLSNGTNVPTQVGQFATATLQLLFFCSGQSSGAPLTPCCPPDPNLEAKLETIINLVNEVIQGLPTTLTSLADGTAHTGLTGAGTITLAGQALAIRVDVTAGAGPGGVNPGSPNYYFGMGFITPLIEGSPQRGGRVVFTKQFISLPQLTSQISFTLGQNVVVTITELVRGP